MTKRLSFFLFWILTSSSLYLVSGFSASPRTSSLFFQEALRDFQATHAGSQIVGCDANTVSTMNAALWGVLADLSRNPVGQTMCMVMEDASIPQSALMSFVTDFKSVQTDERLRPLLPEFDRIQINLLKPDEPAFVLTSINESKVSQQQQQQQATFTTTAVDIGLTEQQCTAALRAFVDTMVVGLQACPYTKTADLSATGLEKRGITPGPVAYRFSSDGNAFAAVATFWDCVNELMSVPETDISTTLLSLPAIGAGITPAHHDRFAAAVELISRSLCLYRGDGAVGLVHFHPAYNRNRIHPVDKAAFGHLPPQSWLRAMLRHNNNDAEAEQFTNDDLFLSNYQRRAPHTMINILRVSQLNAAVGAKSIVDLQFDDGSTEKASGITLYSRNAIRLAQEGKAKLDTDLQNIWERHG